MKKEYISFIVDSIRDIIISQCRENGNNKKVTCVFVIDDVENDIVSSNDEIMIYIQFKDLFRFYDLAIDTLMRIRDMENFKFCITVKTLKLFNEIYDDYIEKIQYRQFDLEFIKEVIFGEEYVNVEERIKSEENLNAYYEQQDYIENVIYCESSTLFRKFMCKLRLNLRKLKKIF